VNYLITFFASFAILTLLQGGCKHASTGELKNEEAAASWPLGYAVTTPNKITYAFSWTNDANSIGNPLTTLESKLAGSRARNAGSNSIDYRTAKAGAGIYGAADPFVSKSFGKYLVILPFASNVKITALGGHYDDPGYLEIVKSEAPGVIYPWSAWMADASGQSSGYAVVVRESSLLDLSRLQVLGPIESDFSCKKLNRAPRVTSWIEALREVPHDFFNCTMGVIHDHAEYFYSPVAQSAFARKHEELLLMFAANIRSGNFLAEAAGVKADAVRCGSGPYCSYNFGLAISESIQSRWEQPPGAEPSPGLKLSLAELIRVAKDYKLLAADQQPASLAALRAALTAKLQELQPDLAETIQSHIVFYNDVMKALSDESMLLWK
jgi:hypothetical protein